MASIPHDVAAAGGRIADYIDRYTNSVASDIRDALGNSSWLPERLRPPKSAGANFFTRAPPPRTWYEKSIDWASDNRTSIAVVVAFASTTYYMVHRAQRAHARKRRAKKLPNGAKKEIIVLVCPSFHDPLTRSLALDLERRGYVVYVTVSSTEEDSLIQQESKADLRPLWMDLTSTVPNPTVDIHPNLEPIKELLTQLPPQASQGRAGPGSSMGNMSLAGIVVFPGCSGYPIGPLAILPPTDIIDTLNTRLLSPMLSIQQSLPLLHNHSTDPLSPSSIVIAYPSIPASLSPPRQTPESIITSSLSTLATSLRRELTAMRANITVHELKLGNFDLATLPSSINSSSNNKSPTRPVRNSAYSPTLNNPPTLDPQAAQLTHQPSLWHSSQRRAAQPQQLPLHPSSIRTSRFIRASPVRHLHNAVFDALAPPAVFHPFGGERKWVVRKTSGTVFVGSGARVYEWIGRWVPGGLVGMVMAFKERREGVWDARGLRRAVVEEVKPDEHEDLEAGVAEGGKGSERGSSAWGSVRGSGSVSPSRTGVGEGDVGESAVWEKV